jgi:oxidoreductase
VTIRTAVVGLGWAGTSIWPPRLREHPAYEVVGVVDPRTGARAAAGPGVRSYTDAANLPAGEIDLVVVAVPNHAHATVAGGLLARGMTVFLEKPVCLSAAEADALAAAERAGGGVLLAGSASVHRADVTALTKLLPDLGVVRHVDLSWVRARGIPDAGGWFTRRELSGGGVLVDLGWHLLDVLHGLLGPVAIERVTAAVTGDFVGDPAWAASWRDDRDAAEDRGDVEDTVRAFLLTDIGVTVFLHASWASHQRLDETSIRVEGTAGVAELSCTFGFSPNRAGGSRLRVTRAGESSPVAVGDEPIGEEYRRQLDLISTEVGRVASRGRAVAEARRTVGMVQGIYHSARRARPEVPAR